MQTEKGKESEEKRQREGQHTTCLACRGQKIKCLEGESADRTCRRCARLDISCEYAERQKPGRRPRNGNSSKSDVEESTKPSASSSSTQHGMARTTGKQLAPLGGHDDGEINHSASTYFGEAHSTRMYHVDDEVGALHFSSSSQAPPYHEVLSSGVRENYADSRSRLDMSRYLDPATGGSGSERSAESPKPPALSGLADPIEVDILSEAEARRLLSLFHTHLGCLIGLFDPQLHTLEYLRSSSPVLTSAILSASSRFFRPDLGASLLGHFRTVLNRAIQECGCDISLVQSLLVSVYWKEVADLSAWMKIGMALRMAYQMRWHEPRRGPLSGSLHNDRLLLDAERTWLCLACFDFTYSSIYDLPRTIQRDQLCDAGAWAREHGHLMHPSDMSLALHLGAGPLIRAAKDTGLTREITPKLRAQMLVETALDLQQYRQTWFEKDPSPPNFDRAVEDHRLWWLMHVELITRLQSVQLDTGADLQAGAIIDLATTIVGIVERLALAGTLRYLQDAASSLLSSLVDQLSKTMPRFSKSIQAAIVDLLHRLLLCLSSSAKGDPSSPAAFVSRFIRRVISAIEASRIAQQIHLPDACAASSIPGPSEIPTMNLSGDLSDMLWFEAGIPSLIFGDGSIPDDQYWESVLPGFTGMWNSH